MDNREATKVLLRAIDGLRDDLYGITEVLQALLTAVTEMKTPIQREDDRDDSRWFADPDERSE